MKQTKKYFILAVSGWLMVGLLTTIYVIKAWTAPANNPPVGNVPGPINVGSSGQEKTGAFTVGSIINNGTLLSKGVATFTPTSNSVNFFNVTDAASTRVFSVDTTNKRIGINKDTPTVAVDIVGALTASSTITGGGFTTASGNIEASAGNVVGNQLCIEADCRAAWPASGSGVPASGMVLSETSTNPLILAAGYTQRVGWEVPYNIGGMPGGNLYVYEKNP